MGSPIVSSDFDIQNFGGDVCEQVKKLLEINNQLRVWFEWAFDSTGESTDAFKALFASIAVPVGSVVWMPVDIIPAGYLKADGRAVSRTTYANLFARVGTLYGNGDGSTTFNVPNAQDKFLLGAGAVNTSVSSSVGSFTKALEDANLPAHFHFGFADENTSGVAPPTAATQVSDNNGGEGSENYVLHQSSLDATIGRTSTTGQGAPFNITPPALVGIWLIKI